MKAPRSFQFDTGKDAENARKHGISLEAAADFEFESAVVAIDDRHAYGKRREVATGYLGDRLHVLVFTWRGDTLRVISLRKANGREIKAYDDKNHSDAP